MCGISGIVGRADAHVVAAMSEAMKHRGPDDHGVFVDERHPVALGHRRLSILDVSPAGHQPMAYRDGRYRIVLNGEIYNFRELRAELETLGHGFRSRSDTEVLVAAYAQWGERCVERLRGMFAFAVFDRGDGHAIAPALFLARDRLGIKPLYYAIRDGVLIFASEIKGLLASGIVPRRVDPQALQHYLALGSVPQPRTILAGAQALPPGHTMTVGLPLDVEVRRYWDIAENSARSYPHTNAMTREESGLALRALLDDAVEHHLLSDVPVGAFLSGGIDSTAVVGLMSRATSHPLETFSVGFDSRSGPGDERSWARMAARAFGTEHTEVIVTGRDVADRYDRLVQAIDQPSLDGTNTFLVAEAAGRSVKVALSGLGGDELFAGYPHFRQFAAAARWDRCTAWLAPALKERVLGALPGRLVPDRPLLALERLARYASLRNLSGSDHGAPTIRAEVMAGVDAAPVSDVYRAWFRPELDAVAQTSYVEVQGYLVNTLLRDVDATAMGNSLEVRPVLLDHPVAEFAFALPARFKLGKRVNKPVLVAAVRDLLPEAIVRRPKAGFELPLGEWLSGPLRERARAAFSSGLARTILSSQYLGRAAGQLSDGGRPGVALWANLMLVEWLAAHKVEV